jgi:threonine synthase
VIAAKMGLPVRLIAAANDNDVFARFMETGSLQPSAAVTVTLSPSMDIQV